MIALGCQQATSTLIGHEIGGNNVKAAKQIFKVTKIISFVILIFGCSVVTVFSQNLISLFLNSRKDGEKSNQDEILKIE